MPTSGDENTGDESLGTKVTPDFKQQVRVVAAHKGMSMSQYVREAVEAQLQEDLEEGNSRLVATPTAD